ncbi:MAG: hypothetical protein WBL25_16230 [Anaerolineales bacterium]
MEEDRNQEPGKRMRNIFSSNDDEANAQFQPKSEPESEQPLQAQSQSRSPLDKLPRLKPSPQLPQQTESEETLPEPETPVSSVPLEKLPQSQLPSQQTMRKTDTQKQAVSPQPTPEMPRREKFLRALWTMTSVISMIVNIVLIIVLVIMFWAYRDIKMPEDVDITMVNKLLSGLYSNFEKMDRASIKTVIPVDAQIPLDIIVPVQTTTQITLSETVNIPNAQVVINTGGLNINSTARVTLPAGTPLTVNLNFDLPVRDTIPVHLEVPVNIPMAETELHEPFVGLQEVVQPIYCFVDPNASNLDGQLICR